MKSTAMLALLALQLSGCTYNANRLAGAGAVTGAIAGAAVGGAIDEAEARNAAIIEQQVGQRFEGAVTHQQVIAMTQSGLSDAVIATHINAYGVARAPTANDLIMLRQAGVSDAVLQALQTAGVPQVQPVAVAPTPVIVHEVSPVVHVPIYPRQRHHHTGFHWGFSVGR